MRRGVALTAALAIAVGALSACSSGEKTPKPASKTASSVSKAQQEAEAKAKQLEAENLAFARSAAQARLEQKLEPASNPKMLGSAWRRDTVAAVNSSVAEVFTNDNISSNYRFLVSEDITNTELTEKVLPALRKIMVSETHALRDLKALGGYATVSQLVTIIKSNYHVDGPMLQILKDIEGRGGQLTAGDIWNLSSFLPPCSSQDRDLVQKLDLATMCDAISDQLTIVDIDAKQSGTRVWKVNQNSYLITVYVDNNSIGAAFRLELPFELPATADENTQPLFRYSSDAILTEYQVLRQKRETDRVKSRTQSDTERGSDSDERDAMRNPDSSTTAGSLQETSYRR